MGCIDYTDAVNGALQRLHTTGFYIGDSFANHAPMAAEALAKLGYCDEVESWVAANLRHRAHRPFPDPAQLITDWRAALGDRSRGGDWVQLFRCELAGTSWREVLRTWWPRLLPGCVGSLSHGLIRTAHAVRSLREAVPPSDLQIDELARALGFWATVFTPLVADPHRSRDLDAAAVDCALSELTAEYAGHYAATMPSFPIPLIHTITAPAAMRLALAEIPEQLHAESFATIAEVNRQFFAAFGGRPISGNEEHAEPDTGLNFISLAAEAVDIGEEHAIKVCEAAMREHALRPDSRYLSAAAAAVHLIRERQRLPYTGNPGAAGN
jgi:hypothetical protein